MTAAEKKPVKQAVHNPRRAALAPSIMEVTPQPLTITTGLALVPLETSLLN